MFLINTDEKELLYNNIVLTFFSMWPLRFKLNSGTIRFTLESHRKRE